MKKRVKNKLGEGVHVSPEVYELLTEASNWWNEELVKQTLINYQRSNRNRVSREDVHEAMYYEMMRMRIVWRGQ
tara:strand:- start:10592 stop:10813 length:222 start_codon:yes stop_codon:yes gene_type:complete